MKCLFTATALFLVVSQLLSCSTAHHPAAVSRAKINRWVQSRTWAGGLTWQLHPSTDMDSFYVAYHRNKRLWDAAFAFLKNQDLQQLPPGKYPIVGEHVFANVTDNPSNRIEDVKWESHKDYIDLQYVISGKEQIGVADTSGAAITKPYTVDVINYQAEGTYYVAQPGTFFLFFPNNAHRPTIRVPGYDRVKKIVLKIQTAQVP